MNLPTISLQNFPWRVVLIVLLVATTYGFGLLLHEQSDLSRKLATLQVVKQEGTALLDQQDTWEKRASWIRRSAPTPDEEGKTKAEVLESVLEGAHDQHLRVIAQSLGDLQGGPTSLSVSARIKVQGTMENLCRWINMWQSPEGFYAVTSVSIHASEDHKTVICSLTIKRFFQETK